MFNAAIFVLGLIFGAGIVLGLAALFHHCDIDPPAVKDTEFL